MRIGYFRVRGGVPSFLALVVAKILLDDWILSLGEVTISLYILKTNYIYKKPRLWSLGLIKDLYIHTYISRRQVINGSTSNASRTTHAYGQVIWDISMVCGKESTDL